LRLDGALVLRLDDVLLVRLELRPLGALRAGDSRAGDWLELLLFLSVAARRPRPRVGDWLADLALLNCVSLAALSRCRERDTLRSLRALF
jgi:hypothetical protein